MKLPFVSIFILSFVACTPAPEVAPIPTPVPAAVSSETLNEYEREKALEILLGNRLSSYKVQNALEVLRRQELPERTTPTDTLSNPFARELSTSSVVVETYPRAGIEVTLKAGKVFEVRNLIETFEPVMWE